VIWQLYRTSLALQSLRTDPQSDTLKLRYIFLVDAIIAVILFGVIFASANGMQECAWKDLQLLMSGALGPALSPIWKGTRKRSHYTVRGSRIVLS
jgi:hypothetical protein